MSIDADWAETTLGECAAWFSGGTPRTSEPKYWNGDIPWISSGSLTSFYINDSERRVTQAGVENGTRLVPKGTVLFVVRGMSLKTEFRVGITKRPVTFGQDCKALIAKPMILPEFLANVLRSKAPEVLSLVEEAGHGTGTLQTDTMKALRVPLPPLDEQRRIVTFISAFDELLALLQETNTTLESIAQAIFKSWFIDFDPVHAKAEGREPEGMDVETAALFPCEFEESELGPIPTGWHVGCFGDIAILSKRTVNPSSQPTIEFEHYSIPAYDSGQLPITEVGASIKSNKTLVPQGAVLMSKLNPHISRVWLPGSVGDNAICSTEFLPWTPHSGASPEMLYCLLKSPPFITAVQTLVTGTSNSHQRVKAEQVAALPVVIPPDEVMLAFQSQVAPFLSRVVQSRYQARTLATLRDELLPRLISGKLRVPEAEEAIEEVLA